MEREETPAMSSETPIKPGDVVRWGTREREWVVGPVNRERGVFMPVDNHDGDCWYSLDGCTIVRSVDEAVSKAVVLALANPLTTEPRFRKWARAEALARGWRELDREDVRERQWGVEIFVGDARIGDLVEKYHLTGRGTASWQAWWIELVGDEVKRTDLGHWPSFDDARDALIAAENARRAKETPHA